MAKTANTASMTEGSAFRHIVRFAVPMALTNVLQLCYTLADSAVVGRILGVRAFASVGASASLHWMAMSAAIGLSIGFETYFAQRFGAKDWKGLRGAFATAAPLSLAFGLLIGLFGVFFGGASLRALGTPKGLQGGAALYVACMLGGMPVTMLNLLLSGALRALGDSKTPLRASVAATLANIVLDVALAFPFGIAGVAAATLASQAAAGALCARALWRIPEAQVRLADANKDSAKGLLRLGLPMAFRNAVIEAGGLAIQAPINARGEPFVAGIAAARRMYSLLCLAAGAMEAASGVFVAQNFGARRMDRVRRGVTVGFWLMIGSSAAVGGLTLAFGRQLLALLVDGEPAELLAVLAAGKAQLDVMACGLPALCMLFLYRSALQGMGNAVAPMASGFVELACRFGAAFFLAPAIGDWGIYLSDAMGWVSAAALLFVAYRLAQARKSAIIQRADAESAASV